MIILNPTEGLCNRMRVINSGLVLNKRNLNLGKTMMVWDKSEELNCEFTDLFEPIDCLNLIQSHFALNFLMFYFGNENLKFLSLLKKRIYAFRITKYQLFNDKLIVPLQHQTNFWDHIDGNLVFRTCCEFYSSADNNEYYQFKPVKALADRINRQINLFSGRVVGVHIRRTDNFRSIRTSSLDMFIGHMSKMLESDNNLSFFISTDDKSVEESFLERFKGYAFAQENKHFDRNSKKGIEDALVDLYTLSHTEKILGSFYSSFSEVASYIHGAPLEIIK